MCELGQMESRLRYLYEGTSHAKMNSPSLEVFKQRPGALKADSCTVLAELSWTFVFLSISSFSYSTGTLSASSL